MHIDKITSDDILTMVMVSYVYLSYYFIAEAIRTKRIEKERDAYKREAGKLGAQLFQLEREIKVMSNQTNNLIMHVGDRFAHFKSGSIYRVIDLFTWEPTKEQAVLYQSETTFEKWGRPLSVFLSELADPTDPTKQIRRFKPVVNEAVPSEHKNS